MLREVNTDLEHFFRDNQWRKQGEYKSWHWNGQLREHSFYVDDNFHGECKVWNSYGRLSDHCFYVNNRLHGEYKSWYHNGQMWNYCFYKNGKKHGEYKSWYENNEVWKHRFYIENRKVSFEEIPYPKTPEDLVYFKLKYDLPLLPMDTVC